MKDKTDKILQDIVWILRDKGYWIKSFKSLGAKGGYIRFESPIRYETELPSNWRYSLPYFMIYTDDSKIGTFKILLKWANKLERSDMM